MAVKRFADEVVAPKVREMDENEKMDPEVIKGLFDNGVSLCLCLQSAIVSVRSLTLW